MQNNQKSTIKLVMIGLTGFIGFLILLGTFTIVSPQEVGIITRLGALNRSVEQGFHFKIPLVEDVTKMNVADQKFVVPNQVYSKDGQTIDTQLTLNYKLNPVNVLDIFKATRNNYQDIIISPILTPVVEEVFSKYTAQELIEKRALLAVEIKNIVVDRVNSRGILVSGVEFTFDFDDQYEAAIRNKQVQEQQALAQVNITAQEKEKKAQEILKAEALSEKTRLEGVALQSAQGEKVISKIYAEAALEIAKKWNGQSCQSNCYGTALTSPLPIVNIGK